MKLTLALISSEKQEGSITEIERLSYSNRDINAIDDLSPAVKLKYLDLSKNALKSGSLTGIKWNIPLKNLNISQNNISSLENMKNMSNLEVLNASHNQISSLDGVLNLKLLKALILNDNKIKNATEFGRFSNLNSLILSGNQISSFEIKIELPNLTKLSLSRNNLHSFPQLAFCSNLKDLRLNGNLLTIVPDIARKMPRLEILDLGNNPINTKESIDNISYLRSLSNLNIKSCPIENNFFSESKVDIGLVQEKFSNLSIFNNIRIKSTRKRAHSDFQKRKKEYKYV